ncbi:hypothetical protein D6827_04010 [Candidatus Parcubacteria bacterium]|nr:MAG: hypothetical protein D6827_04010 [Candidatus Parcubacteria bacterium]
MEISRHYSAYPEKTILVAANNELAKIFLLNNREATEQATIFFDQNNSENDSLFYKPLANSLANLLKKDFKKIILCAPEVKIKKIHSAMPLIVQDAIDETVPKNLASLPIEAIIRILQEKKPS